MTAVDSDLIHTWQRENGEYLNSPFSIKCRDNFSRSGIGKGLSPGRRRFPAQAGGRAAIATAPVRSMRASVRRPVRRRKGPPRDRARLRVKESCGRAWLHTEDSPPPRRIFHLFVREDFPA